MNLAWINSSINSKGKIQAWISTLKNRNYFSDFEVKEKLVSTNGKVTLTHA